MNRTKSRFAVAAVVAALYFPGLASARAPTSVEGDPNFPAIENPAPALALGAVGGEAEALRADPAWPATESVAPAIRMTTEHVDELQLSSVEGWEPDTHCAIELAPKTERVAAVK